MTRRKVLKQGAGLPALVPASALGLGGAVPPSDRIAMAAIGVGNRGTSVLRDFLKQPDAQIVAKCDVNADNLSRAIHLANGRYGNKDCKGYKDFQAARTARASAITATEFVIDGGTIPTV
ncbi:MAG: hypothetical protein ACRD44_18875 [Bryobacteraceae bacterium]